ncbi:PAC2 family protein [Herbiconiux sp. KACC 21604]|uniref:proteasome assembly chaperone family protein n=1 Tax=unclassified Herbiconiux TaxID=2618217 RepID=UPI001490C5C3|nr:PAC2 family protein [Herbiconiux sp. SALV-R1]QJU53666.1 PAC2 family protein [Herbiconiux sp. SALV-R1]WPO84669.1 PAC2 family protein [Herbiconiux sp. KACC 21604]
MDDPRGLYDIVADDGFVPEGLPLVAALTGFTDAGGAVSQLGDYLLDSLQSSVVVEFDADILLDYRARRPVITFDQDHVSEYEPQTLRLHLVTDELGQRFLFLNGFEPDFQWERFAAAVIQLVDRFKVSTTTWVHAIPMPVPHTRPINVTVSGNRIELIDALSVWRPSTQAPANVLHLVEYRLQELGHPIAGFVLLVPHYLADTEYPATALVGVESISSATGLIFPTDRLREEGRVFASKIDEQVQSNAELARLVQTLEERHDAYMEGTSLRSPLTDVDGELPSADEIADELERFLAGNRPGDDSPEATGR